MENLFECRNVNKRLGGFVLKNISFELKPGYILGVIGRNGSGKTTLLRTLMGSYRMTDADVKQSDVVINGESIIKDEKKYKAQIAYVLNDTPFDTTMTAREVGMLYGRYYKSFDMNKYTELLFGFGIRPKHTIMSMSKGEQIKQQLAFSLSYDARVYFLDEPTGNLDVEFRDMFYGYIRKMVSSGTSSVIYASHLVEEMEEFADYILWLRQEDGAADIKFIGSIDELRESYRMVEADEKITQSIPKELIVGGRKRENHQEMLVLADERILTGEVRKSCRYPELREIMYYEEKQREGEGLL